MVVPSMKAALIGAGVLVAALGVFLIFSLRTTHTDVMTNPVAAPAPIGAGAGERDPAENMKRVYL